MGFWYFKTTTGEKYEFMEGIQFFKRNSIIQKLEKGCIYNCSYSKAEEIFKRVEEICLPVDTLEIEESAFYGHKNLKRVLIPEKSELTIIGENAFAFCENLGYFEFENCKNLIKIRNRAFYDVKAITSEKVPEGVHIAKNAFSYDGVDIDIKKQLGVYYLLEYYMTYRKYTKNTSDDFYILKDLMEMRTYKALMKDDLKLYEEPKEFLVYLLYLELNGRTIAWEKHVDLSTKV